ncbi:MAG: iron-containing alcohol dehydrogenase [Thermoplasmataceae archaeon]
MWFFRSPEVVFGEDSLSHLNSLGKKKFLIVTDRNIVKTKLVEMVKESIDPSSETMVFSAIGEEPGEDEILSGMKEIRRFSPEVVIGLGGGSSLDTAKIIYAMNERQDLTPYDITPINPLNLGKRSVLVAIPTTSGTGSDCSWAAVFSGSSEKRKNEIASPEILPHISILDPSMVISLPPEQTRNTATDAITHAIEAYGSQWRNPYSDAMAEKSIELITESLPEVMRDPGNAFHRGNVHIGASMAGIAFSNSQVGLAHAMGHALGAMFKIAHGKAVGLYLPSVIRFNSKAVGERYERLNRIFPTAFRGKSLDETVEKFLTSVGQAISLQGTGIKESDYRSSLNGMVDLAMESTGILTNPADSEAAQIRELFLEVV